MLRNDCTVKLFEVRDKATCIAAFAFKPAEIWGNTNDIDEFLLRRCGFPPNNNAIIFGKLDYGTAHVDPYNWDNRTMHEAHLYVEENYDKLASGSIIDVQFILGETTKQCESDSKSYAD